MKPVKLRCEHAQNPLGINVPKPRLSWQLESDRLGARQTAYQLKVTRGGDTIWDTGRVESDQSQYLEYNGPSLGAGERAHWSVRVWDEQDGDAASEEAAWWETGIDEWNGQWIGGSISGGPRTSSPVPFLRKEVSLRGKPVRARLYATAAGVYEFRINGHKVGDDFFAPGWTDYRKRLQYQAYDVTDMLTGGQNALGAVLGDGWYCGHVEWRGRQLYGDRPALLAQLVITYEDGTNETFITDGSWRAAYGPILEADMLMGESYDARREMPGWDMPGFQEGAASPTNEAIEGAGATIAGSFMLPADRDSVTGPPPRWTDVEILEAPAGKLVAMQGPTVKATQELTPIAPPTEIKRWPSSDYIFDLGQNMVGFARLKVKGPAGTTIRLRFGEILDKGQLYTENLRSARQTDYYTLRGDEEGEVWEPRFTFHGFRYVEVRGYPGEPPQDAITGIVLHSDIPKTGEFECSDELVNQLQRNIDWGQRGNFVDIPTDCPQRDERLGWTGDAQVFVRTAAFNRDVAGFFTKWQDDVRDSQGIEGQIPPICPSTGVVGGDGGPAWSDAAIICPWTIYQCYGDRQILETHYDSMKAFVGYLEATAIAYIRCHPEYKGFKGFGDWLSINADTPPDLIGTAFYAYSAHLLSQIARVLGRSGDEQRYQDLFDTVKGAFQRRYVTAEGLVGTGSQTSYLLALHFDLLPEDLRPKAMQALVDDYEKRGWKLSSGFVGSPYINHVLTNFGRSDVAYRLLFQKEWPSWLYAVTQGATTIWERWDGWTHDKGFQDVGMNPFNHYAYGAIGSWLYQRVAGIDIDPSRPGYKHIHFHPVLGEGLDHARATLESRYGMIESGWKVRDGKFEWELRVPPNTTASIISPVHGGKWFAWRGGQWTPFELNENELPSGRFRFEGAVSAQ
jgi:alpha-L-rhamnosidase